MMVTSALCKGKLTSTDLSVLPRRMPGRAAVLEAAKIEDDDTWRTKLPDFLIQQALSLRSACAQHVMWSKVRPSKRFLQVPVVGCSTVLLRETLAFNAYAAAWECGCSQPCLSQLVSAFAVTWRSRKALEEHPAMCAGGTPVWPLG